MRIYSLLLLLFLVACQPNQENTKIVIEGNPAAEGFNTADSDEKAIQLADAVMEAMGGRNAWENTRHIKWNFFGRRTLYWDKQAHLLRLEVPKDSIVVLLDLNKGTGKVAKAGKEIQEEEPKAYWLKSARSIWNNDSYWLLMPFKLKDAGVTLKYIGQDSMDSGAPSQTLALSFREVGDTPNNKYIVHVGEDNLVQQWDFYSNASDTIPRFKTPWGAYQKHGKLLLSSDRGKNQLSDIQIFEDLPTSVYQEISTVSIKK